MLSAPQTSGLKWTNQVVHGLPCPHLLVWHAVWDAFLHELQTSLSLIQCALRQWGLLDRAKQENKSSMLVKPIQTISTNKSLLGEKRQDITDDSLRSSAYTWVSLSKSASLNLGKTFNLAYVMYFFNRSWGSICKQAKIPWDTEDTINIKVRLLQQQGFS